MSVSGIAQAVKKVLGGIGRAFGNVFGRKRPAT
jgi:hypothetical protein